MKEFYAKELTIKGKNIRFIGDPHLGRKFQTGVPLHRRGVRERIQFDTFEEQLTPNDDTNSIIIVGDLFDKFRVSNEVLLETVRALRWKAVTYSHVNYYVLMGNHDISRDRSLVSAFNILKNSLDASDLPNLCIIDELFAESGEGWEGLDMLFVPYNEQFTGVQILQEFIDGPYQHVEKSVHYDLVVGHWDLEAIAGNIPHNIIPLEQLAQLTDLAVTGHYHVERWDLTPTEGLKVLCTGSMQPYAHGEEGKDVVDPVYVTVPLADLLGKLNEDPDFYKGNCVRVEMKPEEDLPSFEALQITKRIISEQVAEDGSLEIALEDFNVRDLLGKTIGNYEICKVVWEEVQNIYDDRVRMSVGE